MDITNMLSALRTERALVEEAILVLEGLARGSGKRRGRPPKWLLQARSQFDQAKPKGRRTVTPEARKVELAGLPRASRSPTCRMPFVPTGQVSPHEQLDSKSDSISAREAERTEGTPTSRT
jgi:hypothetical protein